MTEREVALCRRAQRAAFEASQPFVRVAVDLLSWSPPTLIVSGDRVVSVRYPDEVEAKLTWLRDMAQKEAQRAADFVLGERFPV